MKVDWIDKVLGETANKKDILVSFKRKKFIEEAGATRSGKEEIVHRLAEIGVEMVCKDKGLHVVYKYRAKVVKKSLNDCICNASF